MTYQVEMQVNGEWLKGASYTDAVELALAMWEMGLQRPDYEAVRIQVEGDTAAQFGVNAQVDYLMRKHRVSRERAEQVYQLHEQDVISASVYLMTHKGAI